MNKPRTIIGAYLLGLSDMGMPVQYRVNVSVPRSADSNFLRDNVALLAERATGLRFDFLSWKPFPEAWTINA